MLPHAAMKFFWEQYLAGTSDIQDPVAVPMRASALEGLPPPTWRLASTIHYAMKPRNKRRV